ncbi:hypothetical protein [Methylobacterium sp. Leaf108]|uniref:hypothetical protein n=1 Tax=Methylobacterium sp. Leaf108 TaxID=1736256 RepID=UPI001FCD1C50|nr:hypothetical protein [Methylobacterium sp. Leaf108]
MTQASNIAESVAEALDRAEKQPGSTAFSPAVLDAIRLADIFSDVNPQEDFLPIDALAGFPVSRLSQQSARD